MGIELTQDLESVLEFIYTHQDFSNSYIQKNCQTDKYSSATINHMTTSLRAYLKDGKTSPYIGKAGYELIDKFRRECKAKLTPSEQNRCRIYKKRKIKTPVHSYFDNSERDNIELNKITNVQSSLDKMKERNTKYGFEKDNFIRIFDNADQRLGYMQALKDSGNEENYKLCKVVISYQ